MARFTRKAEFVLTGTSPLLMHADDVEASDMLGVWRKDPANKRLSTPGDDRSPAWTWQTYWYLDDEGNMTIPSDNLRACLCHAGGKIPLKRQETLKRLVASGIQMPDDYLEFRSNGEKVSATSFVENRDEKFTDQQKRARKMGFDLFVKRGTVNTAKHVRVRPKFKNWSVSGTFILTAPEFDDEKLTQLFEIAGYSAGLGDWRPSAPKKPGRHGMFEAKVKILKD